jgi:hypothetical protein
MLERLTMPTWDPKPLEKALEAGLALRRDDYLRLFAAYFSAAKTRQDGNYGLNGNDGLKRP